MSTTNNRGLEAEQHTFLQGSAHFSANKSLAHEEIQIQHVYIPLICSARYHFGKTAQIRFTGKSTKRREITKRKSLLKDSVIRVLISIITHVVGCGYKSTQLLSEKYCCFVYTEKLKSQRIKIQHFLIILTENII